MSNLNDFIYGQPADVAERLMSTNTDQISHAELVGALANAMNRIDRLERQIMRAGRTPRDED